MQIISPGQAHLPGLLVGAALLALVLLLEVGVEPVGPLPDAPDVQREGAGHLRRRGDGEGVPFTEM